MSAISTTDRLSTTRFLGTEWFLGIQGSYKRLELALFKSHECVDILTDVDTHASSLIIPYIKTILDRNKIKLEEISFLAVDNGPGAFTSLRVVVSTVNALAFSTGIKLIGVDGLDAVAEETYTLSSKTTNHLIVALLNAYNNDVYHAVYKVVNDQLQLCDTKGYKKVDLFLDELLKKFPCEHFLFTGNGVSLLDVSRTPVSQTQVSKIKQVIVEVASAKQIGLMGLRNWKLGKNIVSELQPIYLKEQTYAVRSAH